MADTVQRHKLIESISRPLLELYEGWEGLAIDAAKWTVTDPAGGTAWTAGITGAYARILVAPALNNVARLVSDQVYIAAPTVYATNTILRRLYLEFEMKMTTKTSFDNTLCFFGLTATAADDRSSNNIIGFGMNADVLTSVTDLGGAELVNTGFGETLEDTWLKLGICVSKGHVQFFVNEVQKSNHYVVANLPSVPMYINFYLDTEGVAGTFQLGVIRAWYEDFVK